ncbi:MAG: hypothetical protein FJ006_11240 [Chloroflexi bacterium]|nr:hypothetical protein [Chloroflexota bacterium]
MPRGDRTGPPTGSDSGRGGRFDRLGGSGNRPGAGPGGECVCPNCGAKLPHQAGIPCYSVSCPKCGADMVRA